MIILISPYELRIFFRISFSQAKIVLILILHLICSRISLIHFLLHLLRKQFSFILIHELIEYHCIIVIKTSWLIHFVILILHLLLILTNKILLIRNNWTSDQTALFWELSFLDWLWNNRLSHLILLNGLFFIFFNFCKSFLLKLFKLLLCCFLF